MRCEKLTSDIKLVADLCSQFQIHDHSKYSTLFECFMKCLKREDMSYYESITDIIEINAYKRKTYYDNHENLSPKIAKAVIPILNDYPGNSNELETLCNYVLSESTKLFGRLLIFLCKKGDDDLRENEGFEMMMDAYFDSLNKKYQHLDYDEMLNVAEIIARANVYEERDEIFYEFCLQMHDTQLVDFIEKLYYHWRDEEGLDLSYIIRDSFLAFLNNTNENSLVEWFHVLKILLSNKHLIGKILETIADYDYDDSLVRESIGGIIDCIPKDMTIDCYHTFFSFALIALENLLDDSLCIEFLIFDLKKYDRVLFLFKTILNCNVVNDVSQLILLEEFQRVLSSGTRNDNTFVKNLFRDLRIDFQANELYGALILARAQNR